MFFLMGGDKKSRKADKNSRNSESTTHVRELFNAGRFPVVTTHEVEGRRIAKVLGLVCCRGYDSEEAFFGMAARAVPPILTPCRSCCSRNFVKEIMLLAMR